MDLPLLVFMRKNTEGQWEIIDTSTDYEQAVLKLKNFRANGDTEYYLVALTFLAGPRTPF